MENCLWSIYKLEICIFFLQMLDKVHGGDESFVVALFMISWLTGFNTIIPGFLIQLLFRFFCPLKTNTVSKIDYKKVLAEVVVFNLPIND